MKYLYDVNLHMWFTQEEQKIVIYMYIIRLRILTVKSDNI